MPPFHALQRTDNNGNATWVTFSDEVAVIEVVELSEVLPALRELEDAQSKGLHAVGWIAYEAAPAFDSSLQVHPTISGQPLLRFTLYKTQNEGLLYREGNEYDFSTPKPSLNQDEFTKAITCIHEAIAAGETYQVNFTYPMYGTYTGDPWTWFRKLRLAQSAQHQAYFEEKDQIVISLSPERFFKHQGDHIFCKPMKGTARPGEESLLKKSEKDRSENIMIVDMIRNDLGKIAIKGSVKSESLFEVESYPSVVQMTSTVSAKGSSSPVDWLCALFPCASITGAPKKQTMKWINQLESGPRGIYTGCIGGFYGDGVTEFNVAIRTAILQPESNTFRYHSGCGIVWDSKPEDEYRESILKSAVLTHETKPFSLIETMRWEPGKGIELWPYHRKRLLRSAAAIGVEVDLEKLDGLISQLEFPKLGKIRLTLSEAGKLEVEKSPLPLTKEPLSFNVDTEITLSSHLELKHKTTRREIYKAARKRHPKVDETLLINENRELMEFSIGNLVWTQNGKAYTPPLSSGFLPGVARAAALDQGKVEERTCRLEDLENAEEIYLINGLRGWVKMVWGVPER